MKIFRKLHLWLSVPFGIIITLVCFSGGMLVFEPEITRMAKKDVYFVSAPTEHPLPVDSLMRVVRATLPDSVDITGVSVSQDPSRTYQVNLSKPRRASIFIDQYTGKITGRYERLGFFSTMFKLHRWLLDSANPHGDGVKVGKLLVGISTLLFVIVLLTGIVLWWPRARHSLGSSLSISFRKGWPGFWKGLHVAGGMYATIIILAMALTGLTWSFDWYRKGFYALFGVEMTPREMKRDAGGGKENARDGKTRIDLGKDTIARRHIRNDSNIEMHGHGRPEETPAIANDGNSGSVPKVDSDKRVLARTEVGEIEKKVIERSGTDEAIEVKASDDGENVRRHGRGGHRGEGHEGRSGRRHHDKGNEGGETPDVSGDSDSRSVDNGAAVETKEAAIVSEVSSGEEDNNIKTNSSDKKRRGHRGEGNRSRGGRGKHGGKYGHSHESGMSTSPEAVTEITDDTPVLPEFCGWQNALDLMRKKYPSSPQITVGAETASATLSSFGNPRASDKYSFDPVTGVLTPERLYSDAKAADKMRGWIYSVHTGVLGGLITRILWALSALLGASLPLTGYYIWIWRLSRKKKH